MIDIIERIAYDLDEILEEPMFLLNRELFEKLANDAITLQELYNELCEEEELR